MANLLYIAPDIPEKFANSEFSILNSCLSFS